MKRTQKHPEEMTAAELANATRDYDRPFAFENARPMTAKERAQEKAMRQGRGRPRIGQGAKKVSISLEAGLLQAADAMAKKQGLNRSELISSLVAAGLKRAS